MAIGEFDTGWQRFTSGTNGTGVADSSLDWANPGFAPQADKVVSVTFDDGLGHGYGTVSEFLMLKGWWSGNNIPADAILKTAEMRCDIKGDSGLPEIAMDLFQVDSNVVGTNISSSILDAYNGDGTWDNAQTIFNFDFDAYAAGRPQTDQIAGGAAGDGMAIQMRIGGFGLSGAKVLSLQNLEVKFTYNLPGGFGILLGAF